MKPAPVLAIVVPCCNESEVLPSTHAVLTRLLEEMKADSLVAHGSFLLYVDDGSTDTTWKLVEGYAASAPGTAGAVRLAANAGHQNALIAGMEAVAGSCDACVTIDADLQDDPAAIRDMVAEYRRGASVVCGVRRSRKSESRFKRRSAAAFYRTMRACGVSSIGNHADFRLLDCHALRNFLEYAERNIYIRGIVPLLGGKTVAVPYDRRARTAGKTKYPLPKMVDFAIDGITSFSVRPLRMVMLTGFIFMVAALAVAVYALIRHFTGWTIPGWTSLMLSIWFCSGMLLFCLGIVGEYIGKIYTEVKHRPRYHLRDAAGKAGAFHKF